jgi:hypothetical protein
MTTGRRRVAARRTARGSEHNRREHNRREHTGNSATGKAAAVRQPGTGGICVSRGREPADRCPFEIRAAERRHCYVTILRVELRSLRLLHQRPRPIDPRPGAALGLPSRGRSKSRIRHFGDWRYKQPRPRAPGHSCTTSPGRSCTRSEGQFVAIYEDECTSVFVAGRLCRNQRQPVASGDCKAIYRGPAGTSFPANIRRGILGATRQGRRSL